MKAIFMTEVGGRLMEVNRRDIQPSPVYYTVVSEPIKAMAMGYDVTVTQPAVAKREKWVCVAKPMTDNDFAVFMFDSVE